MNPRILTFVVVVSGCFLLWSCSDDPGPDVIDNLNVEESDAGEEDTADAQTDATSPDTTAQNDEEPPEHCFDGELSGDETDVDCGGSCPPCEDGQSCEIRPDCISLECDQQELVCVSPDCPNYCSGNGECIDEVCECDEGYTGIDCSQLECPNDCSGNGECVDGVCHCETGWTGLDCSQVDESPGDCPNDCSGNGECVDGVCHCDAGWKGYDCSQEDDGSEPTCPNDCNGNGDCVNGSCVCHSGWSGIDCSQQDCPNNCSGNGSCTNGSCICDPGWSGPDCSIAD